MEKEVNKWKTRFKKLCTAIDKLLGRKPKEKEDIEDYEEYLMQLIMVITIIMKKTKIKIKTILI